MALMCLGWARCGPLCTASFLLLNQYGLAVTAVNVNLVQLCACRSASSLGSHTTAEVRQLAVLTAIWVSNSSAGADAGMQLASRTACRSRSSPEVQGHGWLQVRM